jgi:RNA polymerase sigma-70 factor, ECF subfamily
MTLQKAMDDISLITKVVQQDQSALSVLYDRYAGVIYAVAYKMLGSVEEAEEVVLDVFAQVWRTARTYDSQKSRVDSWLFMQTRSRTLDILRKRKRQARTVDVSKQVASDSAGVLPDEHVVIRERRDRIQAALAQIPAEQRRVIELAYFQGLTQSEIAQVTGWSLGTVKTRIRLGLSKLRGLYDITNS